MTTSAFHPELNLQHAPDSLRRLRRRLFRAWLNQHGRTHGGRLAWLAAGEAEALAWQTAAPLLVLPALLAEKLDHVRDYGARRRAPT